MVKAWPKRVGSSYVRLGSLADIYNAKRHVRSTPNNGHVQRNSECPLCANSGHHSFQVCFPRGLFLLFELRAVPLELFHKGHSYSRNKPNLIRGHGQKMLGGIDPGHKKCPYCLTTEATICKLQVLVRFCSHGASRAFSGHACGQCCRRSGRRLLSLGAGRSQPIAQR
jgi:hypothetical protein